MELGQNKTRIVTICIVFCLLSAGLVIIIQPFDNKQGDFVITADCQKQVVRDIILIQIEYRINNTGEESLQSLALVPSTDTRKLSITGLRSQAAVTITSDNRVLFNTIPPNRSVTGVITVAISPNVTAEQLINLNVINGFDEERTSQSKTLRLSVEQPTDSESRVHCVNA
jgi:hypothetical protein